MDKDAHSYRIAWIPIKGDICLNNLEAVEKIGGHFIDISAYYWVTELPTHDNDDSPTLPEKAATHLCNQLNNQRFDSDGSYIVVPAVHR